MHISQLVPFAIGTAAENKKLRSHELIVLPQEVLPFVDGELKENPTPLEFSGTDSKGQAYQGKITTDNVIRALWLPESSNRVTSPDVRRGERIVLYRFGDSDQYYWRPMGLDDHLRKLETIIFAISATKDESKKTLDIESCYFVEMSSHTKQITVHTSKANGEAFAYDFQIDADLSKVLLTDDGGNYFLLDSANTHIRMENADGTYYELDKQKIKGYAPQTIDFIAGQRMSVTVGGTKMTWLPGQTILKTPVFTGLR